MAALTIDTFVGLNNRVLANPEVNRSSVIKAHNVTITDTGALYARRKDRPLATVETGHIHVSCGDCDELPVDSCQPVSWYESMGCSNLVHGDSIYCACSPIPVNIPPPIPPQVTYQFLATEQSHSTTYAVAYQFCNGFESALSHPSNRGLYSPGQPPLVILDGVIPAGVEKLLLYREVTGFRSGTEEVSEPLTNYFLVAELSPADVMHVDEAKTLGRQPNRNKIPAPEGIQQLQVIPETRRLVGFKNKTVYLSMPGDPFDYADQHVTLDSTIIGVAASRGLITVATTTGVYSITNYSAYEPFCPTVVKRSDPTYPVLCCQSVVASEYGNFIVTDAGILHDVDAMQPMRNITSNWFPRDVWLNYLSNDMVMSLHYTDLIFTTNRETFVLDIRDGGHLTTLDAKPEAFVTTLTRQVVYTENGTQYQMFGSNDKRVAEWQYRLVAGTKFSARNYEIDAMGDTALGVSCGEPIPEFIRTKGCVRPVAIGNRVNIAVRTDDVVYRVTIGSSDKAVTVSHAA